MRKVRDLLMIVFIVSWAFFSIAERMVSRQVKRDEMKYWDGFHAVWIYEAHPKEKMTITGMKFSNMMTMDIPSTSVPAGSTVKIYVKGSKTMVRIEKAKGETK